MFPPSLGFFLYFVLAGICFIAADESVPQDFGFRNLSQTYDAHDAPLVACRPEHAPGVHHGRRHPRTQRHEATFDSVSCLHHARNLFDCRPYDDGRHRQKHNLHESAYAVNRKRRNPSVINHKVSNPSKFWKKMTFVCV